MPISHGAPISKACIKQIKVAQRQLKLRDNDYRSILRRVAGVSSSTELTQSSFALVMDEFAQMGFISTARSEAAKQESRAPWASSHAQRSKITVMWATWKGEHDPEGLRRWLEKKHGVSDLQFVSAEKARKIIGALSSFKKKPKTGSNAI
jgi:phage gp16-like protein